MTKEQTLNNLIATGNKMSNILYCLKQQEGLVLSKKDCKLLEKFVEEWDTLLNQYSTKPM
jgi:histidinol phosphatase-like enzyme